MAKVAATTTARRRPVVAKRDWAHVVDVNREIVNFRELVPDMAREVRRVQVAQPLCTDQITDTLPAAVSLRARHIPERSHLPHGSRRIRIRRCSHLGR